MCSFLTNQNPPGTQKEPTRNQTKWRKNTKEPINIRVLVAFTQFSHADLNSSTFASHCIKNEVFADLVTFTDEILNGKLHFLCRVMLVIMVVPQVRLVKIANEHGVLLG